MEHQSSVCQENESLELAHLNSFVSHLVAGCSRDNEEANSFGSEMRVVFFALSSVWAVQISTGGLKYFMTVGMLSNYECHISIRIRIIFIYISLLILEAFKDNQRFSPML